MHDRDLTGMNTIRHCHCYQAVRNNPAVSVRDGLPNNTGQINLYETIRQSLRTHSIARLIGEQVHAILRYNAKPMA